MNIILFEKEELANELFLKKYLLEKGHLNKGKPSMIMVIEGKLLYLKMVKGDSDSTYLKLKNRFVNLLKINSKASIDSEKSGNQEVISLPKKLSYLMKLTELNEIFKDGFDNALKKYIG